MNAGGHNSKIQSSSSGGTAGLFIHRSGSKPLPMSGNRFVVPNLPFLKKTHPTNGTASATVLRRAGDNSAFSDQGKELLPGDEDNVTDAWICAHCSSKNHTRYKEICSICKQTKREKTEPASPRRGRRPHRGHVPEQRAEGQPIGHHRPISAARSWSPPRALPKQRLATFSRSASVDLTSSPTASVDTNDTLGNAPLSPATAPVQTQTPGRPSAERESVQSVLQSSLCSKPGNSLSPAPEMLQVLNLPKFGQDWEGGTLV